MAPDTIVATKYVNNQQAQGADRTRPLRTYPLVAKWKGTGSNTSAENFACINQ